MQPLDPMSEGQFSGASETLQQKLRALLDNVQGSRGRSASVVRRETSAVITATLLSVGRLVVADGEPYFVDKGRAIRLRPGELDLDLLLAARGLDFGSRRARGVAQDLRISAFEAGEVIPSAVFSVFDRKSSTAMILCDNAGLVRISPSGVDLVPNAQSVLVRPSFWGDPPHLDLTLSEPALLPRLLRGLPFLGDADQQEAQRLALLAALVASIVPEALTTLPVLVVTGDAAGILRLVEMIGAALAGPRFYAVRPMRERELVDLLAAAPLAAVTVENSCPRWLAPCLVAATRRQILRRGKDGDVGMVRTRALPLIVMPAPGFRDPALQRASVTLVLGEPPRALLAEVLDQPDLLVRELLWFVRQIIGDLGTVPLEFAKFIDHVARAFGGPEGTLAALSTQARAPIDPDREFLGQLRLWLSTDGNEARRISLADLAREMEALTRARGERLQVGGARALAQRFHRLRPVLVRELAMEVHRMRSRGREVSFRVKSSVSTSQATRDVSPRALAMDTVDRCSR